jgi:hypothetical protein
VEFSFSFLLTDGEFIEAVNDFISELIEGISNVLDDILVGEVLVGGK